MSLTSENGKQFNLQPEKDREKHVPCTDIDQEKDVICRDGSDSEHEPLIIDIPNNASKPGLRHHELTTNNNCIKDSMSKRSVRPGSSPDNVVNLFDTEEIEQNTEIVNDAIPILPQKKSHIHITSKSQLIDNPVGFQQSQAGEDDEDGALQIDLGSKMYGDTSSERSEETAHGGTEFTHQSKTSADSQRDSTKVDKNVSIGSPCSLYDAAHNARPLQNPNTTETRTKQIPLTSDQIDLLLDYSICTQSKNGVLKEALPKDSIVTNSASKFNSVNSSGSSTNTTPIPTPSHVASKMVIDSGASSDFQPLIVNVRGNCNSITDQPMGCKSSTACVDTSMLLGCLSNPENSASTLTTSDKTSNSSKAGSNMVSTTQHKTLTSLLQLAQEKNVDTASRHKEVTLPGTVIKNSPHHSVSEPFKHAPSVLLLTGTGQTACLKNSVPIKYVGSTMLNSSPSIGKSAILSSSSSCVSERDLLTSNKRVAHPVSSAAVSQVVFKNKNLNQTRNVTLLFQKDHPLHNLGTLQKNRTILPKVSANVSDSITNMRDAPRNTPIICSLGTPNICSSRDYISRNHRSLPEVSSLSDYNVTTVTPSKKRTPTSDFDLELEEISKNTCLNFSLQKDDLFSLELISKESCQQQGDDSRTFACFVCQDKFYSKSGLDFHLFRKIFRITYERDGAQFTFDNKCQFWMHINQKVNPNDFGYIGKSKVTLQPKTQASIDLYSHLADLYLDKFGSEFEKENLASQIDHTETGLNESNVSQINHRETGLNETNASKKDHMISRETCSNSDSQLLLDLGIQCKNCLKIFCGKVTFEHHLNSKVDGTTINCNICYMELPTECALKAHEKIHTLTPKNASKFWCPECGKCDFSENEKDFFLIFEHLDECLHFNRVRAIECECKVIFQDEGSFNLHFLQKHMQVLYKCSTCNIAFVSDYSRLIEHCRQNHKKILLTVNPCMFCLSCRGVCRTQAEVCRHLRHHFVTGTKKNMWKCFLCSVTFQTKDILMKHTMSVHSHKAKRCTMCFRLFSNRKILVNHIMMKKCSRALPKNLHVCVDLPTVDGYDSSMSGSMLVAFRAARLNTHLKLVLAIKRTNISNIAGSIVSKSTTLSSTSQNTTSCPQSSIASAHTQLSNTSACTQPLNTSARTQPSNASAHTQPSNTSACTQSSNASARTQPFQSENGEQQNQETSQLTITPLKSRKRKVNSTKENSTSSPRDTEPFQCHTCKVIIRGATNFSGHLRQHGLRGRYISPDVTRCVVCKRLIANHALTCHIQEHQKKGVKICNKCQRRDFKTLKEALEHSKSFCDYRFVEGEGDIAEIEKENQAIQTEQREMCSNDSPINVMEDKDDTENVDEEAEKNDADDATEDSSSLQTVLVPCLLCGMTFVDKSAHDDHVSRMHDGTRTVYYCLICHKKGKQKLFKKRDIVVKHITAKHKLTSAGAIDKFIKEEEQNVTSGKELLASTSEGGDIQPQKRLRVEAQGDFLCGKCAFSCTDSDEFAKHVSSHNTKKEPQCPECGLCFTVVTALKKHLFVVHKIKSTDAYLKEKGLVESEEEDDDDAMMTQQYVAYPPSPPKDVFDKGSADKRKRKHSGTNSPLECNVCYRIFKTEAILKTHMRNHGMAFIRSKRQKE